VSLGATVAVLTIRFAAVFEPAFGMMLIVTRAKDDVVLQTAICLTMVVVDVGVV
jgi:hypothetical protein